jgi:diaminopropionate ammonia-lyase
MALNPATRLVPGTPDPSRVPAPMDALAFHQSLPGYEPTPLRVSEGLARGAGLDRVYVKDESSRLGLPAFKFLGASWAVARMLGAGDLEGLTLAAREQGVTRLTTATDGNHGRAVARMARLLGLAATIYVPPFVAPARKEAIAGEGAAVQVVDGVYEDAVRASLADAAGDPGCRAVNDADLEGGSDIGSWVIEGYGTLFAEAGEQLGDAPVDIVVLQLGVGGFAAAGIRWATSRGIAAVGAEPAKAACVAASIAAGRPVEIDAHHTTMGCLVAGMPSIAAWPTLESGLAGVVVLADEESDEAARILAGDGIESGESGAAGAAGLLALMTDPALTPLRDRLGTVTTALVVSTEGATDPARYAEVIAGRVA